MHRSDHNGVQRLISEFEVMHVPRDLRFWRAMPSKPSATGPYHGNETDSNPLQWNMSKYEYFLDTSDLFFHFLLISANF